MCECLTPVARDWTRRRLLVGVGGLLLTACAPLRRSRTARPPCTASRRPAVLPAPAAPVRRHGRVVRREAWGAEPLKPNHDPMGGVERITLHHTAELPSMEQRTDAELVKAVQHLHRNERGWADIGYHWIIGRGGDVFEGRSVDAQGAHAGSGHNGHNLGISVIGDFTAALPPAAALETLAAFLDGQRVRYRVPVAQLFGHRDFKATACPGDALYRWLTAFKARRGPPA